MVKVPYVSVYDLGIALFDLPVTLIFCYRDYARLKVYDIMLLSA